MKPTRIWKLFLLGGFVCAALFGQTGPATAQSSGGGANTFQSYAKPMPLPDFFLEDLSGKIVQIRDCRGKVLILHFWATW